MVIALKYLVEGGDIRKLELFADLTDGDTLSQQVCSPLQPSLGIIVLYCDPHDLREGAGKIAIAIVKHGGDISQMLDIG